MAFCLLSLAVFLMTSILQATHHPTAQEIDSLYWSYRRRNTTHKHLHFKSFLALLQFCFNVTYKCRGNRQLEIPFKKKSCLFLAFALASATAPATSSKLWSWCQNFYELLNLSCDTWVSGYVELGIFCNKKRIFILYTLLYWSINWTFLSWVSIVMRDAGLMRHISWIGKSCIVVG